MYHFVAHARGLAFRDWLEAAALWQRVATRLPGTRAAVLMPDHLHILATTSDPAPLDAGLRAYALWRNHHRGERGPVWLPRPAVERLANATHHRRSVRYVHLNPCRAGLADCPAAWPFSTHRDALGLAASPVVRQAGDAIDFHRYVSADPSADVQGTEFPAGALHDDRPPLRLIAAAVSEIARVPLPCVYQRTAARRLFLSAATSLTSWRRAEVASHVGVHPSRASRAGPLPSPVATAILRVLGDPRFPGLVVPDPRIRRTRRR